MIDKRVLGVSLLAIWALLLGYIFSQYLLILLSMGFVCCMLALLRPKGATCVLFLFAPLSHIIAYKQYNLYIFFVVAYMGNLLIRDKLKLMSSVLAAIILIYCVLFAHPSMPLKIGYFIYPLFLLLILFVCKNTKKEDYKEIINFFIIGFAISAVVGMFKARMPLMAEQFGVDYLYINGIVNFMDIQRYSGLALDPNFFALINCVVISVLLFANKHWSIVKGVLLTFLIAVGFFTFSKSYVLMLAIIFGFYLIKHRRYAFRLLLCVLAILLCLVIVELFTGIRVLKLIQARFDSADDVNGLTTGRIDLWGHYLEYIFKNPKCLLLGEGFNALSLDKAAHNSYIEFLYHFGVVGCLLWFIYFWACVKAVVCAQAQKSQRRTIMPIFICLISVFFLSSFHFQQLWCCICISLFASYIPREGNKYAEIECHYSNLQ